VVPVKRQRGLLAVVALFGVASLGAIAWILTAELTTPTTLAGEGLVAVPADTGGPFELIGQDGRQITQAALAGSFAMVYFGYSDCPDICPTSLLTIANVLEQLGHFMNA
jgi:protein SCO1/2